MAVEYVTLVCDDEPVSVVLTDPGPRPVEVVKLLRRRTGPSLWQGRLLVDDVPAVVLDDVPRETAEAAVRDLLATGAGAGAELRSGFDVLGTARG
ncbi:ribosomal protein L7/L12 [Kitasatospora sp. NPDC056327]|uniref:ribosomal protein L7/L12 n=1 Tax=Kitasatospora sp. NPDC056327 TaxID=3345785 RepID=UPI0035E36DEE